MRILYLGNIDNNVYEFLKEKTEELIDVNEVISIQEINKIKPDVIISYGYRYILNKDIVEEYRNKIINLHISYLPYNKGADPNFWSFYEGTPKGVSIHFIDEGIDTGTIILKRQHRSLDHGKWTLKSSYEFLKRNIEELFIVNFDYLMLAVDRKLYIPANNTKGNFHTTRDMRNVKHLLVDGWETDVNIIKNKGVMNE